MDCLSAQLAKRESGVNPEQSCCCIRAVSLVSIVESMRRERKRYCVSQNTCLEFFYHLQHAIVGGDVGLFVMHFFTLHLQCENTCKELFLCLIHQTK